MGKPWAGHSMSFKDVHELLKQVEKEHAVKVRLTVVPRPSSGYKQGVIVLATPYDIKGRKMADIQAEQHLFPSNGFASREALEVYLLHRLLGVLDERQHQRAREAEQAEPERMTPLEEYIARSF